jgi:hypothetical protein
MRASMAVRQSLNKVDIGEDGEDVAEEGSEQDEPGYAEA